MSVQTKTNAEERHAEDVTPLRADPQRRLWWLESRRRRLIGLPSSRLLWTILLMSLAMVVGPLLLHMRILLNTFLMRRRLKDLGSDVGWSSQLTLDRYLVRGWMPGACS